MHLKLLTYNLFFNKALEHIDHVLSVEKPDIILLQEFQTSSVGFTPIEKKGYKLANFSNSFFKHNTTYGVATFYNPKKLTCLKSDSIDLPRSLYELLLILFYGGNKPRTVLKTEFEVISDKKHFTVYNIHLSWFNTNSLRIKQLKEIFRKIELNGNSILIGGDFNYPYGRRKFEELINQFDLHEATTSIYHTFEKRLLGFIKLKWKLDYILYHNIHTISAKKVDVTNSDHYPIVSTFTL